MVKKCSERGFLSEQNRAYCLHCLTKLPITDASINHFVIVAEVMSCTIRQQAEIKGYKVIYIENLEEFTCRRP